MSAAPTAPPSPVSTTRKVFAVLFYIAAGFAVYATVFTAFLKGSWLNDQLRATVPSAFVTVVLLLIAIALNPRWRWQRTTAFTLLGGGGFMVVVGILVVALAAMRSSMNRGLLLDIGPAPSASAFVIGGVLLAAVLLVAVVLLRRTPPLQNPPAQ